MRGNKRWNAIAQACMAIGQLVVTLLLVRILAVGDFGRVAMVYLVSGLVAVLDEGGLSTMLVSADERRGERLSSAFWQEVLMGVALASAVALLAPVIELAFAQPGLRSFLYALAPMFVLTAPRRHAQAVLSRDYDFYGMSIARVMAAAIFVAVTVALALAGYGVWSLVIGLVCRMGTESAGFVLAARGRLGVSRPPWGYLRSGYGWSGVVKVGERFLNYAVDRVDLLIIGQALGPTALGVYDVFKRLSIGVYQQVIPAFSRVLLPHLARLQSEPLVLAKAYARQLRYICSLLFPAYLFQAVFAADLIAVVFGGEWVAYTSIFRWISLLLLVRSVNGPVDALLMARGWVKRELAYSLVAVGLVAGALLYAIGEGLEAAVVSVTVINLAMCVPVYVWIVRPAGFVGRSQYARALGGPLLVAALSAALAYASANALGDAPAMRLLVGLGILVVASAVGSVLIDASARRRLKAALYPD